MFNIFFVLLKTCKTNFLTLSDAAQVFLTGVSRSREPITAHGAFTSLDDGFYLSQHVQPIDRLLCSQPANQQLALNISARMARQRFLMPSVYFQPTEVRGHIFFIFIFLFFSPQRGKRVSQIRIRRASPRETLLTPMGLPKLKRSVRMVEG